MQWNMKNFRPKSSIIFCKDNHRKIFCNLILTSTYFAQSSTLSSWFWSLPKHNWRAVCKVEHNVIVHRHMSNTLACYLVIVIKVPVTNATILFFMISRIPSSLNLPSKRFWKKIIYHIYMLWYIQSAFLSKYITYL